MKLQNAIDTVERKIEGMPSSGFQDAIIKLLTFALNCQEIHKNKTLHSGEACDKYDALIEAE